MRHIKLTAANEADRARLVEVLQSTTFFPSTETFPVVPDTFDSSFNYKELFKLIALDTDQMPIVYTREDVSLGFDASFRVNVVGGIIDSVDIIDGGQGYAPLTQFQLNIVDADGVGADVTATTDAGGVFITTNIADGGTGYSDPTVSASVPAGIGATFTVGETGGVIDELNIGVAGTGYSPLTTYTLTVVGAPGVDAVLTATTNASGVFITTNIVDGGTGYVTPTATVASGSDAEFNLTIVDGEITAIGINAPGSGYAPSTIYYLIITDEAGSGATLTATTNISGAFASSAVVAGGEGYEVLGAIPVGATPSFNGDFINPDNWVTKYGLSQAPTIETFNYAETSRSGHSTQTSLHTFKSLRFK